jgi:hypothetical protein
MYPTIEECNTSLNNNYAKSLGVDGHYRLYILARRVGLSARRAWRTASFLSRISLLVRL